jgi:protein involved in polysaccharide export with SLBB domain
VVPFWRFPYNTQFIRKQLQEQRLPDRGVSRTDRGLLQMGAILHRVRTLIGAPRNLHWAALFLLSLIGFLSAAPAQQQPSQQGADLPADEIIQILQENPDLLADAKAEIASQLQARGYPVSEHDITDQRLFDEIRSDERVQHVMSDALKQRGFGVEETAQPAQTQPAGAAPGAARTGQPRAGVPVGQGKGAGQRPSEGARQPSRGPSAQQYPLRNLPAMRDLYTQALNPPKTLERFGAALFRNSVETAEKSAQKAPSDIPVGPDYVIGPGDELVVDYWGRSSQRLKVTVDREGRILLPEAGSVIVAGRTLGDAEQSIQRLLSRQFRDITVNVTLGKLRTVRVYVVGDVKNPGAYDISSLSTPLTALIAAGGPTDTGSYRIVKHFRNRKLVEEVDLYDLMLKGMTAGEVHMESGDSIQVPTVGPQVTVEGSVRRPAIYELNHEHTLDQALELAGGVPVTGELQNVKVERVEAHARKEMLNVSLPAGGQAAVEEAFKRIEIKDGDTITVAPILPYTNQAVYLQGHVFRPGKYPYKEGMKVTDIISSFSDLLPEAADRAEIVRLHPPDYSPVVIGFNLRDLLEKHASAPTLQPFDTIRVFGRYETDAPKVAIYGEVLRPGEYPLSEHLTAAQLVRLAGGFKRSAYRDSADLSSYEVVNGTRIELEHRKVPIGQALAGEPDTDVLLKPGDVLTISQIGGWSDIGGAINVVGQVLHPGRYGIQSGEKLSSVIKRAGGMRADAYPYGAILERAQVREFSARNRDEMIAKLQEANLSMGRTVSTAVSRQNQQLIDRLKQIQPSGRLVIHITAQIEKWENTPADIEVRPGDSLFIPKRPDFVMVAGQVYSSAAITYTKGKNAGWYLNQAGGPTTAANKKDMFVVRANGTVVGRGSGEWWSGGVTSAVLHPGDTIYVPDKVSGSSLFKNISQSVQILTGVAVAASVIRTF